MANNLKYSKCCRVCLKMTDSLKNVFNQYFDSIVYSQLISVISGIEISEDKQFLPIQICENCEVLLLSSYEFRKTCIDSNEKLINFSAELELDADNIKIEETYFDEEFNQDSNSTTEIKIEEKVESPKEEAPKKHFFNRKKAKKLKNSDESSSSESDTGSVYEPEIVVPKRPKKEKTIKSIKIPKKDKSEKQRYKVDRKAPIKCTLCKITLANHSEYYVHRRVEHQKMAVCPICGKSMAKPTLNTHLNSVHNHSTDFKCDICQKGFKAKVNLNNHITTFHNKELRFKCLHCDQKFVHRMARTTHTDRVHLNFKRFSCKVCPSKFFEANGLRTHVMRHHTGGERKYKCDICFKSFLNISLYNYHLKAVHSSERDCSCHICGKKFALNSYLQKHMKIHDDVKDYNCPVCFKGFSTVTPFRAHMKTSHPDFDMPPPGTILCKTDLIKN